MDLELAGKSVLITGGSKGIGRAVAEVMAQEGCRLILVARGAEALEATAADLRSRFDAEVVTEVADMSLSAVQHRVAEAHGGVDILVNNAGANPPGEVDQVDEETWRQAWDLKVFGYINMTRALYTRMKDRGSGVIVNVIGESGERMNARYILGSTGNAGLMAFTRTLGARAPDFGLRVVGVNPGLTATGRAVFMLKGWSEQKYGTPDRWQEFEEELNLPFGRMGSAREVADVVAFLASPRAAYVSGTIVTVDGGGANRHH